MSPGATTTFRRLAAAALLATAVILAGCGSGAQSPPPPPPPPPVSITLSVSSPNIALGLSQQVTVTGRYSDGREGPLAPSLFTWSSSAPQVATVAGGMVQSLAMGKAQISATSGALSAALEVSVTEPVLLSLKLAPPAASIPLGDVQQFTLQAVHSNRTENVTTDSQWSISDPAVASLAGGYAQSGALGSATITATYGGKSATAPLTVTDGFTLALLPDTQYAAAEAHGANRQMFYAQTQWIVTHREAWNIRAVVSLGDIVDCPGDIKQFPIADTAYRTLDFAGIPYLATLGNHDYDHPGCGKVGPRRTDSYNKVFGPQRVAAYSWYGASRYPAGKNDNHYILFEVGTRKYLAIALEFAPRDAALEWAQQVIDQYPDRYVILATHVYMASNVSRRALPGDIGGYPGFFEFTEPPNSGEDMWQKLVRKNRNIFLVVSGHFAGVPTRRVDPADHGNRVAQMCVDYQHDGRGGSGLLRLLRIRHFQNSLEATSYSPYLNLSLTDPANQFTMEFSAMVSP